MFEYDENLLLVLLLVGAAAIVVYNLPTELKYRSDIKRGNELIESIEGHITRTGIIPKPNDWETLGLIGFTDDEMEKAYPEIRILNDTTYELVFTIGFDPPYLMWNSNERVWKEDFLSIPEERQLYT